MYANEILLVEDDSTDAKFFERAVKGLDQPPTFIWCKNAEEALHELSKRNKDNPPPRLAIFDIKMPGINGLELLDQVRRQELLRILPVIIMSSSDEPKDIRRAYATGANSYIVKPTRFRDLRKLVESIDTFWLHSNRVLAA